MIDNNRLKHIFEVAKLMKEKYSNVRVTPISMNRMNTQNGYDYSLTPRSIPAINVLRYSNQEHQKQLPVNLTDLEIIGSDDDDE